MYITDNYSFTAVSTFFDHFFPGLVDPERILMHRKWFDKLKVRGEEAIIKNSIGTDIFSMNIGTKHIGGVIVEYYPWEVIRNKTFFQTEETSIGEIIYIRQNTFEEIINPSKTPQMATEIAYVWVIPEYRKWKYGRNLWDYAISRVKLIASHSDILFTMSKSGTTGSFKAQLVFDRILKVEEETNGRNSEGIVNLTGIWLSSLEVLLTTSIDLSGIGTRSDAKPVETLARRSGMRRVGYSSNLSKVWVIEM